MISILLATYNGNSYLPRQLDSLLAQKGPEFRIDIRDDHSADGTFQTARDYAARYPGLISASRNETPSGSASGNFFGMLRECREDYVMFCDQDDVWLPDKVERTLARMRELEARYGAETPLLVHTDLSVVDGQLNMVDPSMFHMQGIHPERDDLPRLLAQNIVTGCTVMVNRPLLSLLDAGIPTRAIMHDWWLALLAAAFGHIGFVAQPTILYRQHSGNNVGAKAARTVSYKLRLLRHVDQVRNNIAITYSQAADFAELYRDRLSAKQRWLVETYAAIPTKNKLVRYLTTYRLGTVKYGVLRKIAMILYI